MAFEMIRLDRASHEPLHEQLYRQIRDELVSATFNNNSSRLPSSHELAVDLGVSRFTVNVAFSRDRKSTRLNSSHTVISYAVFCLKKKKNKKKKHNEIQ